MLFVSGSGPSRMALAGLAQVRYILDTVGGMYNVLAGFAQVCHDCCCGLSTYTQVLTTSAAAGGPQSVHDVDACSHSR